MSPQKNPDSKDNPHRLERLIQELNETMSLSRMAILNIQTQIDRLSTQNHSIQSQLDKIDKNTEKINLDDPNLLSHITQQHHSTQQKLDNLSTLSQHNLQEQKNTTEYLKKIDNLPNYTEHLNTIDQHITQLAVKNSLNPLYQSLHQGLDEQKKLLQHISHKLEEQDSSSLGNIETVASKQDIGEVIVRLEHMQLNEKENISILGQRVSQMPTSHQLGQIYYKVNQSADKKLLFTLWFILLLVMVSGFLFQSQISQILGNFWSVFLQIAS